MPFPAMTLPEIEARLTAPGQPFEVRDEVIRGVPTRVWANIPPTFRDLYATARSHGERTFLVLDDERVTYAAWAKATARLADWLVDHGVRPGDRVAIVMRNLPEWPVAFFAAVTIGAIAVPLNAWWTGAELAYGLEDSGAAVLIADGERWERIAPSAAPPTVLVARATGALERGGSLEEVIGRPGEWAALPDAPLPPANPQADADATLFYTSGTTGHPKGAVGSQRAMLTNIGSTGWAGTRAALRRGEVPPEPAPKVLLVVIPLFHVTACSATLMGAMAGGHTLVFMRRWDPVEAFGIIERERVNMTGGVPTIAWQLLEHPERGRFDLSSLEVVSYGGAPAAPELARQLHAVFGVAPGNGWGMTETTATVTSHAGEDYLNRPDSAGPPVPVAELQVRGADGTTVLPPGTVGELWAKGPQVVRGYWNKPEATAATFVGGWCRTGDLARLDDDGFLFIVDRAKDMIIRGGENIYCVEVENALFDHPAVTDAALIALPHRTLGEEPAAVVHLAPGASATADELRAWVAERLAAFKVPVRVAFSEATLPRNANGKILKGELKALFEGVGA